MRGTLHSAQRYLEGYLKTFGGSCRNSVRSGSGEHVSNEFDGLTHHISQARSKIRMFKRLNGSSQRPGLRCHPVKSNPQRVVPILNNRVWARLNKALSVAIGSGVLKGDILMAPSWYSLLA